MLNYEGSEEPESVSDATDSVVEAQPSEQRRSHEQVDANAQDRMAAELREQLDKPLPPWLDPALPPIPPAPTAVPRQPIPWRSATVAVLAQIPATLEAAFLDVPLMWLTVQVLVVAVMGLCLVLAEWMSIHRVGLAREAPQPNLERPHPHRDPHR